MHRWVRGTETAEVTCLIHYRCHLSCRANHEWYPIPGSESVPTIVTRRTRKRKLTISPSSPLRTQPMARIPSLNFVYAGFCTRGRRIPTHLLGLMVPEECLLGIPPTHDGRIDWASQPPAGEADARSQIPWIRATAIGWNGMGRSDTVPVLRARQTSHYQCLGSCLEVLTRGGNGGGGDVRSEIFSLPSSLPPW
jgi:hypothetical protein